MAAALIKHEQITTTLPKAKDLRPVVEKLITLGKRGGLHARRQVARLAAGRRSWRTSCSTRWPTRYKSRAGGYTRVLKAGFRYGDKAPMAVIELVDRDVRRQGPGFAARPQAKAEAESEAVAGVSARSDRSRRRAALSAALFRYRSRVCAVARRMARTASAMHDAACGSAIARIGVIAGARCSQSPCRRWRQRRACRDLDAQQIQLTFAPLVKKVAPAVVNIYTKQVVQQQALSPFFDDPFFQQFFGDEFDFGQPTRAGRRTRSAPASSSRADGLDRHQQPRHRRRRRDHASCSRRPRIRRQGRRAGRAHRPRGAAHRRQGREAADARARAIPTTSRSATWCWRSAIRSASARP